LLHLFILLLQLSVLLHQLFDYLSILLLLFTGISSLFLHLFLPILGNSPNIRQLFLEFSHHRSVYFLQSSGVSIHSCNEIK
ncbi:hypothetical protein PMAYCL1PPCAC_26480, partial [Pristionchus mayeri]